MLTKIMWKSTIENILNNKRIYEDEKKYDSYLDIILTVFATLFSILFDIILLPLEIISYLIYKKI